FSLQSLMSRVRNSRLRLFILYTLSTGSYRYLLAFFAICDIITTIAHALLQPYVHMTATGFYFFPRWGGIIIQGRPLDTPLCLTFISTYYQTFLVLAYHFVYRYKTITRYADENNWSTQWITQWILVGVIIYIVYNAGFVVTVGIGMTPSEETRSLVPSEIRELYGIDLTDPRTGFTVLALRRPDPLTNETHWSAESGIAISICLCLFAGTATVILFCTYQTTVAITSSGAQLTPSIRHMHHQLFRALLIQV
ncbi:hypothetical protein PMAYCL1PPCAC_14819, partial [Pristionchus mayeri]